MTGDLSVENSNLGASSSNRGKTSDELSKKILGGLQGKFTGEETAHWIADVNKEPATAITKTHSEPVHLSSIAFLDKLFDDFQRYAYELSKAETAEKVDVVVNRPEAPPAATQPSETTVIFSGTLKSGSWALVMQAQQHKIVAYIVPMENLSTFAGRESFFSSYIDIDATPDESGVTWRVDGQLILDSMMSYLSKKLFGILIRVVSGTALPAERFSMDANSKEALSLSDKLGQNRRSILAGFEIFVAGVDFEVDNLNALAMKGIAVLDKEHSREVMVRTNHLKMWREKLLTLGEELKEIMHE